MSSTSRSSIFMPFPRLAPCLFLLTAVFLSYGNVFQNVLLYDDGLLIQLNTHLSSLGHFINFFSESTTAGAHVSGGFYRPLQMILYFLIYQIQGSIPFGFHLLNLGLHAADACLLYRLALRLKLSEGAAFFAALLWAVHPLHTEAITYVSGTADPLCLFFLLCGLLTLFPDFSLKRFTIATIYMVLALLSKETAVVFAPLATLTMVFANPKVLSAKSYWQTGPLWILAFFFTLWRILAPGFDGPQTYEHLYSTPDFANLGSYAGHITYRIFTFFATLPAYGVLLLLPTGLHMDHYFLVYTEFNHFEVILGLLILIVALALIIIFYKRIPIIAYGLLWFAITYAPDSGILVAVNALFYEHWMYIPSMGLFLALAAGTERLITNAKALSTTLTLSTSLIALSASLALGIMTFKQNEIWNNPISFYSNIIAYGHAPARVHNNLALAYVETGEIQKSIDEFRQSIALSDTAPEARHNLAITLLRLPDQKTHIADAIQQLNRALEIDPNFFRSYYLLAIIYDYQGDKKKAEAMKQKGDEILKAMDSKLMAPGVLMDKSTP